MISEQRGLPEQKKVVRKEVDRERTSQEKSLKAKVLHISEALSLPNIVVPESFLKRRLKNFFMEITLEELEVLNSLPKEMARVVNFLLKLDEEDIDALGGSPIFQEVSPSKLKNLKSVKQLLINEKIGSARKLFDEVESTSDSILLNAIKKNLDSLALSSLVFWRQSLDSRGGRILQDWFSITKDDIGRINKSAFSKFVERFYINDGPLWNNPEILLTMIKNGVDFAVMENREAGFITKNIDNPFFSIAEEQREAMINSGFSEDVLITAYRNPSEAGVLGELIQERLLVRQKMKELIAAGLWKEYRAESNNLNKNLDRIRNLSAIDAIMSRHNYELSSAEKLELSRLNTHDLNEVLDVFTLEEVKALMRRGDVELPTATRVQKQLRELKGQDVSLDTIVQVSNIPNGIEEIQKCIESGFEFDELLRFPFLISPLINKK